MLEITMVACVRLCIRHVTGEALMWSSVLILNYKLSNLERQKAVFVGVFSQIVEPIESFVCFGGVNTHICLFLTTFDARSRLKPKITR